jgi:uncharacterized low-complexity protein
MKYFIAAASAALLLSIATTASIAEDQQSTDTDRTRHTMGDSGKLPASSATSSQVPDMGAGTGTGAGTEGNSHRMGDEGKLPATDSMSGQVPKMSKPQDTDK